MIQIQEQTVINIFCSKGLEIPNYVGQAVKDNEDIYVFVPKHPDGWTELTSLNLQEIANELDKLNKK